MKAMLSLLVEVAVFASLIAVALLPWYVAREILDLRGPWPMLTGLAAMGLILFGLYRWILHLQRKARTVLHRGSHEVFGEIQGFVDHWEALAAVDGAQVQVSGDSTEPNDIQASTFLALRQRYRDFRVESFKRFGELFKEIGLSVLESELQLESVDLHSDAAGSFDLTFEIPAHPRKVPWGITARFEDFTVDEVTDNH